MKKLFIFDIDDVIYDLKTMMYEALKAHTGKDIHPNTWKTLNMNEVFDLDYKEVVDVFLKHNVLTSGQLNFGIYPLLDYLKKNNIETKAVTARGWHPDADNVTQAFFEQHDIKMGGVKVIKYTEKKSDYIAQLTDYNIVGYVDDSDRHIMETKLACHGNVKNYFIQDQPWNRHVAIDTGMTRINDISEIKQHLEIYLGSESKPEATRRTKFKNQ